MPCKCFASYMHSFTATSVSRVIGKGDDALLSATDVTACGQYTDTGKTEPALGSAFIFQWVYIVLTH